MASNIDVSAAPSQIKHDVFISFRGKDTRKNFTSHLLAGLDGNGIDAFTDKGLKGGEVISTTLSNKICKSQVSVVVFSQNYAESKWCLDELVRIMQCKDVNGQTVLPVFLQGVEPTHIRHQTSTFGKAFGRLLKDASNADKVASWRHALKQAANLSGWHSKGKDLLALGAASHFYAHAEVYLVSLAYPSSELLVFRLFHYPYLWPKNPTARSPYAVGTNLT